MLMENATKVGLPLTPDIGKASQKFKFSDREFLLTPEKTSIDVEITFNINQDTNNAMYVWNTLRRWYDLVWNSQTGETFYTIKKVLYFVGLLTTTVRSTDWMDSILIGQLQLSESH
jgi:hypothetical protein